MEATLLSVDHCAVHGTCRVTTATENRQRKLALVYDVIYQAEARIKPGMGN